MFGNFTYLLLLLLFVGLPLLFIAWRWPRALWRQRRALGWTILGSLVGGWGWDAIAVRWGIWYFEPAHIANLWFLGLPLEEWIWIAGTTSLFATLTVVLMERPGKV